VCFSKVGDGEVVDPLSWGLQDLANELLLPHPTTSTSKERACACWCGKLGGNKAVADKPGPGLGHVLAMHQAKGYRLTLVTSTC